MTTAPATDTVRAMVILPSLSGLPRDVFVNTFHFYCPTLNDAAVGSIQGKLAGFYTTNHGSGKLIDRLSPGVARASGATVRMYDLADSRPRPVRLGSFPLPSGGDANGLPDEVAITLSYYSNRNIPRQRGRVFLGPWGTSVSTSEAGDRSVAIDVRNTICDAAKALANDVGDGIVWGVFSEMDNHLTYPVSDGWVDNAFDTVRKRGMKSTARTIWHALG